MTEFQIIDIAYLKVMSDDLLLHSDGSLIKEKVDISVEKYYDLDDFKKTIQR